MTGLKYNLFWRKCLISLVYGREYSLIVKVCCTVCCKDNYTFFNENVPKYFPKQTDCFNYIKILLQMNSTHLYVCGTYAFSPTCAYIVSVCVISHCCSDSLCATAACVEDLKSCVIHSFSRCCVFPQKLITLVPLWVFVY